MIVRILGEGQFEVPGDLLDSLNSHDTRIEAALKAGDDAAFRASLLDLLAVVRDRGTPVAADYLGPSDITLPASEATPEEVRELLAEDGLIPG